MIRINFGELTAELDPAGARLAGLWQSDVLIVDGHQDPCALFAYRGTVLAPWPNRLAQGQWQWEGETFNADINEPATNSALHGLLAKSTFAIAACSDTHVEFVHVMPACPAYPQPLEIRVTYTLGPTGLASRITARNIGTHRAPVGLGVHPYLSAPGLVDDLTLCIPAAQAPQFDLQWNELSRLPVADSVLDFRVPRKLGTQDIDAAWTGLERDTNGQIAVRVMRPDGIEVTMWAGETCRWIVVYTGHTLPAPDTRRSIAIEPMTCSANALRTGVDLDILEPEEAVSLDWGYRLSSTK